MQDNEMTTYFVPAMSCGHCSAAITQELRAVRAVQSVEVDLDTKMVWVGGHGIDEAAVIAAIDEAGYGATRT